MSILPVRVSNINTQDATSAPPPPPPSSPDDVLPGAPGSVVVHATGPRPSLPNIRLGSRGGARVGAGRPRKLPVTDLLLWLDGAFAQGHYGYDLDHYAYWYRDFSLEMDRGTGTQTHLLGQKHTDVPASIIVGKILAHALVAGFGKHRDLINDALMKHTYEAHQRYKKDIIESICVPLTPEDKALGTAELEKFMAVLCGQARKLDVVVMKQFLWQIKMKLKNQVPKPHIMPFVYSQRQGTGKSTVLKFLLKPLKRLKQTTDKSTLEDARWHSNFEKYYALIFDDIDQISKANRGIIKSIITGEERSHRELYTSYTSNLKVNATLIATSNHPLHEVFSDKTGMRRFWQIDVKEEELTDDKVYVYENEIDYDLIWRCVSHEDESPAWPYRHQLQKHQDDYTEYRASHRFADTCLKHDPKGKALGQDLYAAFKAWAVAEGFDAEKLMTRAAFLKDIVTRKIPKHRTSRGTIYRCAILPEVEWRKPKSFDELYDEGDDAEVVPKSLDIGEEDVQVALEETLEGLIKYIQP
jgi:hypothetical protein